MQLDQSRLQPQMTFTLVQMSVAIYTYSLWCSPRK